VWVAIIATYALVSLGAPQNITVKGSVQPAPAPGHSFLVDVSDDRGNERGKGQINSDGTFQFPAEGQSQESVNVTIRDGAKLLYNDTQPLGTPWEIQIGPLDGGAPPDSAVARAVEWSLLFSLIAALVELQFRSKASLFSCFVGSSFLYVALAGFFNTLAAAMAASLLQTKLPGGPVLTPMFYALFGVFAFEAVLSNTNITIFGKGVLAFQEWTGKARDPAVTAVQHRQVQIESDRTTALANRLIRLDDGKLTAYLLDAFGKDAGERLIQDSETYQQKYHADAKFLRALAFARAFPDRATSSLK